MDGFVNYWHRPYRATSLNLAVARVFVCLLAAWKVFAYPFAGIAAYPTDLVKEGAPALWALWPGYGQWIAREQCLAVICLIACAFGIAPGFAAVTAAAIIAHLTAVVWPVCCEKTWLPTVYFLLLYGVFRHEDRLVLWPAQRSGSEANPRGAGSAPCTQGFALHSLRWFLVTIALIYFCTGLHKLEGGGWFIEWGSPVNMSRMLEKRAFIRGDPLPPLAAWLQQSPALLGAIGAATIVLELGLLIAVLANRLLTPCFLGLAAMHLGFWATMRLNYFTDFGAMYLVFLPWDTIYEAIARSWTALLARGFRS